MKTPGPLPILVAIAALAGVGAAEYLITTSDPRSAMLRVISRWQMNDGWNAVFNGNESVVDWGILSFAMNAGKADPHNFEHFHARRVRDREVGRQRRLRSLGVPQRGVAMHWKAKGDSR